LWTDILKADYQFSENNPEIERDESGNVLSIRNNSQLGEFTTEKGAIVYIDNVASEMVSEGVSINDISHLIKLLVDVDIHEHSHEAMQKELRPHYDKLTDRLVTLIKQINATNHQELLPILKKHISDYTEMLFMEELYAYSSEKHAKMKDLRHNYDFMSWIQKGLKELFDELSNAQVNTINILAQTSEQKWNMLYLTFETRILKIKGD
tara:strand:+ start:66 stop:689 length:624 start_codon:yes stop_codon:yes gene_type:complete